VKACFHAAVEETFMTSRPSILVVDDDPDLLRLMQIRLAAAGYAVTTAESGERALAQLAAARPRLVVTDLRMNGMDGMALFDAIHAAHPALPVIILTAHGTIPDAVSAVKKGSSAISPNLSIPRSCLRQSSARSWPVAA
jgi:two-component system response regulator GlrR